MTKKNKYVQRFFLLLTCAGLLIMLSACGQKGPLYLPKNSVLEYQSDSNR